MKTTVTVKGNFKNARHFLTAVKNRDTKKALEQCGEIMVNGLKANSKVDTGQYKNGWNYSIQTSRNSNSLEIYNSSHADTPELPFWLEYGHGTGTGGYVPGDGHISKTVAEEKPKCLEIIEKLGE